MAVTTTTTGSEPYHWHEAGIMRALVGIDRPFDRRKNLMAVPNLSHAMLNYEADLVVCSKSGYLTEVEVKVSASDWKADQRKTKWVTRIDGSRGLNSTRIKRFYYAAPLELAVRWEEFGIPEFAGVYGAVQSHGYIRFNLVRPAKDISNHRKLTEDEQRDFVRLAAVRFWDAQEHIENLQQQIRMLRETIAAKG